MRNAFRLREVLLALLLAGSFGGCAGRSVGEPQAGAYDRDVIGADEIAAVEVRTTARQLIERSRPMWLRGRGPSGVRSSDAPVAIYVNNQRLTGESPLDRYTAGELVEIRYLNAMAATQRFGTGHTQGAILLTTR